MSNKLMFPNQHCQQEFEFEKSDFDTSELGSLLSTEDKTLIKGPKGKTIELIKMTNVLTIIFSIYMLVFILLSMRYVPTIYSTYVHKTGNLLKMKAELSSFPHFFRDFHILTKTLLNMTHFCLLILLGFMYYIHYKQHPGSKGKFVLLISSSCFSIICLMNLTFNYDSTLELSRKISINENIFYPLSMISAALIFISFQSIYTTTQVPKSGLQSSSFILMVTNIFAYLMALLVLSYYTPKLTGDIERSFLVVVALCKEVNSYLFNIGFMMCVLSTKSSLNVIEINLSIAAEEVDEKYIDLEDNNKYTL